jgi:iron(III) transport system ATP-binding protein
MRIIIINTLKHMLSIQNYLKSYQQHTVLSDFSLTLKNGEILAMLGDSGSGKSSVLRFIAGLDEAQNGSVVLDSEQLSTDGKHHIEPESRKVGMVFQDYALFPHMTVAKNIAFGVSHQSKNEQQLRVRELLSLIDLKGIEKKYPHQLSGGEQQRVSLARALAPSPKLLLLDEPFSSLDKSHREALVVQVRAILKKTNTTSILVTHDKNEANMFSDKIGIIKNQQFFIN